MRVVARADKGEIPEGKHNIFLYLVSLNFGKYDLLAILTLPDLGGILDPVVSLQSNIAASFTSPLIRSPPSRWYLAFYLGLIG